MTRDPNTEIEISLEPTIALSEYGTIPIAFEVDRVFDITVPDTGIVDIVLTERLLDHSYIKNYDAIPGEGPAIWANRFDISDWGIFAARIRNHLVGGAIVAINTPELEMTRGCADIAILWDIRVAPKARGKGAGSALFRAAKDRAAMKGCRRLMVETQNINVPACRFYARQGCVIGSVDRAAYPELPDEIQMIWHKDLK